MDNTDKYVWEIDSIETMSDDDRFLIVVGTKEYLITKSNLQKVLNGLSSDNSNKLSKIIIDGDGAKLLTNKGEYQDPISFFNTAQVSKNINGLIEITGCHTHDNKVLLDKLTIDTETGKLFYNDSPIASDYKLPIATTETLGGVKVDGATITITDDGVISGASTYELPTASDTVLGGVKIDNDTIKINNGVISADVIGNWSAGFDYPVGYFVVYDEVLYECIVANNDVEWTENNWLLIGSKNTGISINNWIVNTDYSVGTLVINGTVIYQCHTEHTSGETFDNTNWTAMTGEKGDKGDNGTTPHIDEITKHWFIGEEDTGIIAEGITKISTTSVIYTGTLSADNWINDGTQYLQSVEFLGMTNDIVPELDLIVSRDISTGLTEKEQWGYITRAETVENAIIVYCYEDVPTVALNFQVKVV